MTVNLTDPIFNDEDKARAYFQEIRWPNGVTSPHCGNANSARIYEIAANPKKKIRAGLRECQDCHGQFTVRTGSVMESSHVALTKWALAYRLIASSKKGMSAHQLHRSIGVTYKTAWFMGHRIREAMRPLSTEPMGGEGKFVEADETYIGGAAKNRAHAKTLAPKEAVVSLVERGGKVRSIHVADVNVSTLKPILAAEIAKDTNLRTDQSPVYTGLGTDFASHETANHSIKEYVRGDAYTNTAEGYFSILNRGIYGTYHHVNAEHLEHYLGEFDFRYNERIALGVTDTFEGVEVGVEALDRFRLDGFHRAGAVEQEADDRLGGGLFDHADPSWGRPNAGGADRVPLTLCWVKCGRRGFAKHAVAVASRLRSASARFQVARYPAPRLHRRAGLDAQ